MEGVEERRQRRTENGNKSKSGVAAGSQFPEGHGSRSRRHGNKRT